MSGLMPLIKRCFQLQKLQKKYKFEAGESETDSLKLFSSRREIGDSHAWMKRGSTLTFDNPVSHTFLRFVQKCHFNDIPD